MAVAVLDCVGPADGAIRIKGRVKAVFQRGERTA
jgi:hypothetical protein